MQLPRALNAAVNIACTLLILMGGAHTLLAEAGDVSYLPTGAKLPDHGLTMQIDTRSIEGSGYRPIHVTIATSNGLPSPTDRHIEVNLQGRSQFAYGSTSLPTVTQTITLAQGASTVSDVMLMPSLVPSYGLEIQTFEDGAYLKELSEYLNTGTWNYQWTEATPSILVLHRNAPARADRAKWMSAQLSASKKKKKEPVEFPDLRVLVNEQSFFVNNGNDIYGMTSRYHVVTSLSSYQRLDILPLMQCPENWLELTNADVIFLELADLKSLNQLAPKRFDALQEWVRTGGNLIVWNAPKTVQPEIDEWFGKVDGNWTRPDTDRRNELSSLRNGNYSGRRYQPAVINDDEVVYGMGNLPERGSLKNLEFGQRDVQFGQIVTISGDPFPGDSKSWNQLIAGTSTDRMFWFRRHGMSRFRPNNGFWSFLIPGVGTAPVTSFQVLITLFVIIIGPVNYFLLRSIGRLNLLVVTVPFGAIFITSLLITYAMFSDGLSTRARIRSVTKLDQSTGKAATWSRQAYYSGLATSQGLQFPKDAAVYDIEQLPLVTNHGQRHLHWADKQIMTRGYFRSRVTHQFLVIQPFETERKLKIEMVDGQLRVTNQLGTNIKCLIVPHAGQAWYGKDIQSGESTSLSPDSKDLQSEFRQMVLDASLETPEGFDRRGMMRRLQNSHRRSVHIQTPDETVGTPAEGTSLMEAAIRPDKFNNPDRYWAIVENFSESLIGTDVAPGEGSLEMIEGTW